MKNLFYLIFIVFSYTQIAYCQQQLHVNWTRFVGADTCCATLTYAIPSRDGGIVFTGEASLYYLIAESGSGDIPPSSYGGVIVGKLDSNHNLMWLQVYGGSHGQSICQTPDGGYAVLAYTGDIGAASGDITGYKGSGDMWLIRIDSMGNFLWGNCYGSDSFDEEAMSIAITKDNGFILLGASNGAGEDVPFHFGGSEFEYDWFVVKTDSLGNKQWVQDLGGSNDELGNGYGSILVADTGYYLIGSSNSTDYNCVDTAWHSGVNTGYDYYILMLDKEGNEVWAKSFGSSGTDIALDGLFDDIDTTILVTGQTSSNDYMVTGNHGATDIWTIKVNKSGGLLWQQALGRPNDDAGTGIAIVRGTGYVVLGSTGDGPIGSDDLEMFILDTLGNTIADTIFGGINSDYAASVFPYKQGYIATGSSLSQLGFTEGNNSGTLAFGERCTISYLSCCPTVSVQNVTANNKQLLVYPNPSTDWVSIKLPVINNEYSSVVVSNMMGQAIYEKKIIQQEQAVDINTYNWAKGVYVVRWQGGDGEILTTKLSVY